MDLVVSCEELATMVGRFDTLGPLFDGVRGVRIRNGWLWKND
jgi:hypothetical protein